MLHLSGNHFREFRRRLHASMQPPIAQSLSMGTAIRLIVCIHSVSRSGPHRCSDPVVCISCTLYIALCMNISVRCPMCRATIDRHDLAAMGYDVSPRQLTRIANGCHAAMDDCSCIARTNFRALLHPASIFGIDSPQLFTRTVCAGTPNIDPLWREEYYRVQIYHHPTVSCTTSVYWHCPVKRPIWTTHCR